MRQLGLALHRGKMTQDKTHTAGGRQISSAGAFLIAEIQAVRAMQQGAHGSLQLLDPRKKTSPWWCPTIAAMATVAPCRSTAFPLKSPSHCPGGVP